MPVLTNPNWSLAELLQNALRRTPSDDSLRSALRRWGADCAAYALKGYERHYCCPSPRQSIIAARMYARGEVAADTLNAFMKEVAEEERRVERDKGPLMSLALAEACSVPTLEGMVELIRLVTPFESKMEKWQKARLVKRLKNKDCEDYPLPKKTRVLSEPSHAMPF